MFLSKIIILTVERVLLVNQKSAIKIVAIKKLLKSSQRKIY